eukprot:gene8755-6158_t
MGTYKEKNCDKQQRRVLMMMRRVAMSVACRCTVLASVRKAVRLVSSRPYNLFLRHVASIKRKPTVSIQIIYLKRRRVIGTKNKIKGEGGNGTNHLTPSPRSINAYTHFRAHQPTDLASPSPKRKKQKPKKKKEYTPPSPYICECTCISLEFYQQISWNAVEGGGSLGAISFQFVYVHCRKGGWNSTSTQNSGVGPA